MAKHLSKSTDPRNILLQKNSHHFFLRTNIGLYWFQYA